MTPTEQDIEEVLLKKIKVIGEQEHSYYGYPVELIGLLAGYITADRKRVALEARIDELKKIEIGGDNIWTVNSGTDTAMLIEERIAELKAQQEKV